MTIEWAIACVALALAGYLFGHLQGARSERHQESLRRADIAVVALEYMRAANLPAFASRRILNYLLTGSVPESRGGQERPVSTLTSSPD